jgi:hypothetical protein
MGFRAGVVRGISYGLFGAADGFGAAARGIGAGVVRAYLYWGQVEPRPGEWRWDVVDALLGQLDSESELWVTVCSSSPWATRQATDFLPPSPAHDLGAYREFVGAVVRRCAGRVRYWQCDNEPSNTGLLWAGTADEYLVQLGAFHGAVKEADPAASVVLGGCGYDVFASEPGSEPRRFFERLLDGGRDHFDAFDAHLYGDPARAAGWLAEAAAMMAAHGYSRPVLVGEHGGPVPFQFPAAEGVLYQAMAQAFSAPPASQSTAELIEQSTRDTPERRAVSALYDRMHDGMGGLPPQLAMFLVGCPPELDAKRHRINARTLVMHTVLALAAGVPRTLYWNLAPEVPGEVDPRQLMGLMFGKLPLMAYRGGEISVRHPAAETFALLAGELAGATGATAVEAGVRAFRVERDGRGPLLVLWDERDVFDGEDEPPVPATVAWTGPATARDAFGGAVEVKEAGDRVTVPVGATPVFIS